jgi:hypothetical protein
MAAREAVGEAVDSRLRPIAMSAITTTFGLAPLVFIPGEGTGLYRGLGAIVLFGLAGAALVQAQQTNRRRVLRRFTRRGWLDEDDRQDILGWAGGGGFSLDGSVRIEAEDRAGLERLLRYCARPPFALERLEPFGDDRLVYYLPKPRPDGQSVLVLTPKTLYSRSGGNPPWHRPTLLPARRSPSCDLLRSASGYA